VRRDYWVRAPAPLAGPALQDAWHATRVALVTPRDDVPERVTGPLGGLSLAEPAHRAVLDALAAGGTATLGALAAATDGAVDAAFELAALGHVAVAQAPDQVDACAARTRRLNRRLAAEPDVAVRASAVTGGGVFAGTPTPLLAALHAD